MALFAANPNAGGVGRSEHVSLESDLSETRAKPNPARPLIRYDVGKGGRGMTTRVCILPDQFASVEIQRSRGAVEEHIVDLRFVDPKPVGVRKIPWRCFYVALAGTLLAVVTATLNFMLPTAATRIGGLLTPVGLGALALACYALCYRLTTESLLFLSIHGRARVLSITGRLGTMRRAQKCAAGLATHIRIAQKQFRQTRQAYLRDEMREHSRLYEQHVLSEEQYNEAKRRILKAHE